MEINRAFRIKTSDQAREAAMTEAELLLREVSAIATMRRPVTNHSRLRWTSSRKSDRFGR
jgi:hypothetical protein